MAPSSEPASLPGMAQVLVQQLKAFETIASEAAVDQAKTKALKSDAECGTTLLSSAVDIAETSSGKLRIMQSQARDLEASVKKATEQAAEMEARRDAAIERVQTLAAEGQKVNTVAHSTMEEVAELKSKLEETQQKVQSRVACIAKQSDSAGANDREYEIKKLRENAQLAKSATEEAQRAHADVQAAFLEIKQVRAKRKAVAE
jgi:uncharacterized coiled-coil DUF342 family protein